MLRSQVFCLEMRDEHISQERSLRQNVVWLSRHPLTREQEYALYFLHSKWVRVEQWSPVYTGTLDMVNHILKFSEDGSFVYLVPPEDYLRELRANSGQLPDFSFRQLIVSYSPNGYHRLTNIIEHNSYEGNFSSHQVIDPKSLSGMTSREVVKFPLPTAPSPVVL